MLPYVIFVPVRNIYPGSLWVTQTCSFQTSSDDPISAKRPLCSQNVIVNPPVYQNLIYQITNCTKLCYHYQMKSSLRQRMPILGLKGPLMNSNSRSLSSYQMKSKVTSLLIVNHLHPYFSHHDIGAWSKLLGKRLTSMIIRLLNYSWNVRLVSNYYQVPKMLECAYNHSIIVKWGNVNIT